MADYSYTGDDNANGDPYLEWIRSLQKRESDQQQAEAKPNEEKPGMLAQLFGGKKEDSKVKNSGGTVNPIFTSEPPPPPPPPKEQRIEFGGGPTTAEEVAQAPQQHPPIQVDPNLIEIDRQPQDPYANAMLQSDAVSQAAPAATASDVLAHEATETTEPAYEPFAEPQERLPTEFGYLQHMQEQVASHPGAVDYGYGQAAQFGQLPSAGEKARQDLTDRAVANMTPEQYQKYKADRESAMVLQQAELEHKARLDDMQRARENLALDQAATEKTDRDIKNLAADAQRIANTKIDPDRYRKTRGIGGAFRDVLGSLFLGLGGRPDLAMQTINQRIEQDIGAQTADIQNQQWGVSQRKNLIAEEYARHGDLHRAREAYRIAAYQSAISDVQTQLQQYDPAGSTAIRGRDALEQLHAAQGKALQAYQETQFKNNLDLAKEQREGAKAMAEIAKMQVETAKLKGQIGGGAGKVKPEDIVSPEELAYIQHATGISFPAGVTRQVVNARLGTTTKTAEIAGKAQEAAGRTQEAAARELEQEGKRRATQVYNPNTGKALTQNGKPVVLPPEQAKDVNATIVGAQKFLDAMSNVRNALAADPSTFDRRKWSQIQADLNAAKTSFIEKVKAKVSKREMEAVNEIIGTDFDSYVARYKDKKTATTSIDTWIRTTKRELPIDLKAVGYDGPSPLVDTSNPPPSKKSDIDKYTETLTNEVPEGASLPTLVPLGASGQDAAEYYAAQGKERASGMFNVQADAFESLRDIVLNPKSTEKAKSDAYGALLHTMQLGPTQAIRARAAATIQELTTPQPGSEEEPGAGVR